MCNDENTYDVRNWLRPEEEAPEWFWEIIASGKQDRGLFRTLCHELPKEQFAQFLQEYRVLANAFVELPFASSPNSGGSEDHLLDTGRWVISQGKGYFLNVWHQPEEFWSLLGQSVIKKKNGKTKQESYGYLPEEIWLERFGEDFRSL